MPNIFLPLHLIIHIHSPLSFIPHLDKIHPNSSITQKHPSIHYIAQQTNQSNFTSLRKSSINWRKTALPFSVVKSSHLCINSHFSQNAQMRSAEKKWKNVFSSNQFQRKASNRFSLPEKRKQFEHVLQLDEEDNPVVVVVKLKGF